MKGIERADRDAKCMCLEIFNTPYEWGVLKIFVGVSLDGYPTFSSLLCTPSHKRF
jgi:hypothetical protein